MKICGFQKLTLLDFPGHLAATVFTGGCNFRCPFCHNSELILPEDFMEEEEILSTLKKRAGVLEGVCVTGGEPTLQADLPSFLEKLKQMGFAVKLDTNGYQPEALKEVCGSGLVDYVAMDIKGAPESYAAIAGVSGLDLGRIEESIRYLMGRPIPYEFRTTVVPELHREEDFSQIGAWLAGADAYYLQAYKDSEYVLDRRFTPPSKEWMEVLKERLLPYIPHTELRGVE